MANVLRGRGMSWALALWSAYIATWTVVTEPGTGQAVGWWLAGVVGAMLLRPASRVAPSGTPPPSTAFPEDVETAPGPADRRKPARR